jgi:DNA polymerase
MSTPTSQAALVRLLDWYRSMGADEAVSEVATDWSQRGDAAPGASFLLTGNGAPPGLSAAPAAKAGAPAVAPLPNRQFPTASPDAALTEARAAARSAATLEALRAALAAFDGCALKATAKNLCFYRGAPAARLMLIGEAPGRDEDIEGRPFVGRAGQLLDKMLAAIDLTEADVHITNIVYWRPPGNRTPTPQEAQVCRPFLERQVELVAPDFIVLLGGAAAKHMLDVADGIMRLRGRWREIEVGGRRIKALATLHPAYLLRTPAHKRLAWRDLLAVRAALDGGT